MLQRQVPGRMPVQIVDTLEVVYIQHHHNHLFTMTHRLRTAALELFLNPVAKRQAGQCIKPRTVRQTPSLEKCKICDHAGLCPFESIHDFGVACYTLEDTPAYVAHRVVHLFMLFVQPLCCQRVNNIETLTVLPEPATENAPAMCVIGQHILSRRDAQHGTAQHPARPGHVGLLRFVEALDEVLNVVAERGIRH